MSSDATILGLTHDYARLVGALLDPVAEDLWCLTVPAEERSWFGGRETLQLAFTLETLERHPDAEMAVVGGAFVEQLVRAIRRRGHYVFRAALGAVDGASADAVFATRVPGGSAEPRDRETRLHAVARLVARVTIGAGAVVSEQLVDSALIDLETGAEVPDSVAAACREATTTQPAASRGPVPVDAGVLERFLPSIERVVTPELERQRAEARRALATELARVAAYYDALLAEVSEKDPEGAARTAIEHDRDRRIQEERRRHETRAEVHPVQLVEWQVPAEVATWRLRVSGRTADVLALRWRVAQATWTVACPRCTRAAETVTVCHEAHAVCGACGTTCADCGEPFCADHGLAACPIDGRAVCGRHAATCPVCARVHCAMHARTCATGPHPTCSACLDTCAACGTDVCRTHATRTPPDAPKGARTLCPDCTVPCEGRASEPVGRDEAAPCSSCERSVCQRHQIACAVDGAVHCSRHLVRSDRSGRYACPEHRAGCAFEPGAVLCSDEVLACGGCGRVACDAHLHACAWCGVTVCVDEWRKQARQCATCAALEAGDMADAVLAAAVRHLGGRRARAWRAAHDAGRTVAEADLGWTRRIVVSVPNGAAEASSAMAHSLFGSRRLQ